MFLLLARTPVCLCAGYLCASVIMHGRECMNACLVSAWCVLYVHCVCVCVYCVCDCVPRFRNMPTPTQNLPILIPQRDNANNHHSFLPSCNAVQLSTSLRCWWTGSSTLPLRTIWVSHHISTPVSHPSTVAKSRKQSNTAPR
jgi:hypothetical protein